MHPRAAISLDVVLFFRRYYNSGRRYVDNGRNRCAPGRATGIKPSIAGAETRERARTKARLKPVYLRETRHSLRLAVTFLLSDAPAPLHMRRVAAAGATSADTTAACAVGKRGKGVTGWLVAGGDTAKYSLCICGKFEDS